MAPRRKSPEDFWREYEAKTGEKVLAHGLGRYMSGWDEFGSIPGTPLWGLIIATSGGFRFHHFPQTGWFTAIFQSASGDEPPKEKTIFIPASDIVSAALHTETKWYKKLFSSAIPRLLIRYSNGTGIEKELLFYVDHQPEGLAEALCAISAN